MRRLLRPRTVLPMGFALGLVVLWEIGAIPVPFDPDAGPILRAALAVGLAVVGAAIGYVLQLAVARLVAPAKGQADDGGDG